MNVFDTRRILQVIAPLGYRETSEPALADLVLLNTCSVREKPETKVIGTLTRLKPLKETRPDVVLGVCGCVGQQHGRALLERIPYLDLVFGTDNIAELPNMLAAVSNGRRPALTKRMPRRDYSFVTVEPEFELGPTAFLTISKGCDKVCSFCIVPRLRGREVSKPAGLVMDEIHAMTTGGVREVTLLGQNVNSWGRDLHDGSGFADLLRRIEDEGGLDRFRFVTSHPADADRKMLESFGRLDGLAEYLHLPLQSGSDRVLKGMRRGYSADDYLGQIETARKACSDIALSTDVIVGFPGETVEDFQATLRLVKAVEFDRMFSFKYSKRPGTLAARMDDDVAEEEKAARLKELQDLQDGITASRMARFEGRVEEVLVEGPSKASALEWKGRTATNWVVNFPDPEGREVGPGDLVDVKIGEIKAHSLRGRAV